MLKSRSFEEAYGNIRDFAQVTPVLYSQALNSELCFELCLKAENLQTTNSFKIRGASNCIVKQLKDIKDLPGIVTASSGNHGQAVAYVANRVGVPACIIMPETAPEAKIKAVRRWGAKIELCGTTSQQRLTRSKELALEKGLLEVPPYDHYDIIAGQGTIGMEILKQVPDVDAVLIPIGGGGLISGIAACIKGARPDVQIIGVEPEHSNSMYQSVQNGEITRLDKTYSAADGLLSLMPGSLTFPLVKKYVDNIILVKEAEIFDALHLCIQYFKTVPEPSGAVSVAGALKYGGDKHKKMIAVVSGGNFDMDKIGCFIKGCP